MTKMTLQQMRQRLLDNDNKQKNGGSSNRDTSYYPFWDIANNSSATIRFVPDKNEKNDWFWVEKKTIKLPFRGIKGGNENKEILMTVPCIEMFGKSCPIQSHIKDWWQDEEMKKSAQIYYRKVSYIYSGFVVQSPLKEEKETVNPVRKFIINKTIHKNILAALMDADIENLPVDYVNGLDFKITKTRTGEYADYSTSSFARKERPLNEDELAAIQEHGLWDLSESKGKEPTEAMIQQMLGMFEDSVNNELFDQSKYPDFKAYNPSAKKDSTTTDDDEVVETAAEVKKTVVSKPVVEEKVEEVKETVSVVESSGTAEKPKKSAQEVLAMLRAKQAKV